MPITTLQTLQAEARERILAILFPISSERFYSKAEQELVDLIADAFSAGIKASIDAIPQEIVGFRKATGDVILGWRLCRNEAKKRLQELLPDQENV